MKKYLLLSTIVLFSSSSHALTPPNAFADSNTSVDEDGNGLGLGNGLGTRSIIKKHKR